MIQNPSFPAQGNGPRSGNFVLANGTVIDAGLIYTSPGAGYVGVYAELPQMTVSAGATTTIPFTVINLGPAEDQFRVFVDGLPSDWIPTPRTTLLQLQAGEQRGLTITVQPPRLPQNRAGHYPLLVHVTSQGAPDQSVEVKVTLWLTAFAEFKTSLVPQVVEAGEPAVVRIHNGGNTQETYTLNLEDPGRQLDFTPPQSQVSIPPGETMTIEFRAAPRRRRLIGGISSQAFTAVVSNSAREMDLQAGQIVSRGLVSPWILLVSLLSCCLLSGLAAAAYSGSAGDGEQTTATMTAQALASQSADLTRIAVILAGNATALTVGPSPALTATAPPLATATALPPSATFTALPPSASPLPTDTAVPTATPVTPAPTATQLPPTASPAPSATQLPSPTAPVGGSGTLVFVSQRDGNSEIYIMNADGSAQARLTDNTADDAHPVWSPDGAHIAFESNRDGNSEIYVMAADGSLQTRLTVNSAADTQPAWSPFGNRLAFVSNRDGNAEIYVMNVDGSAQTRLTDTPASEAGPLWSPDGARIAFVSNRDGSNQIYIMNADGSAQTRMTNTNSDACCLAWSPDGARIAYVSSQDGNNEIYVMNADGSGQVRLTNNPAPDTSPAWSPDGARLAFLSARDGNTELYLMNANGTGQTRLTNDPGTECCIVWSPDGARLAFAADPDGNFEIYTLLIDLVNGSRQSRLTFNQAFDAPAMWRR